MSGAVNQQKVSPISFRDVEWQPAYRTSTTKPDGTPTNILHDFYIPVLRHSIQYDRVAGYFRSSSLAIASQGFSSFIGRNGQMRLVVGADLQEDDVAAILEGDSKRLEDQLNSRLDGHEQWPEEETRGGEAVGLDGRPGLPGGPGGVSRPLQNRKGSALYRQQ
jgi:hypothetical protein